VVDLTPDFVDDAVGWAGDRLSDLGGVVAKTAEGAWDLATDPIEAIYAEVERGLSVLRDKLGDIADFASNPAGDATSLRTAAATWRAVAEALRAEAQSLDGQGPVLGRTWKGANGEQFLQGLGAFTSSMGEVEQGADQVARLLDRGGDLIDNLNREVQELVIETLGWITFSLVLGLITGGGGLLLGCERVAAVVVKVKELVSTAKAALVALRVAEAVRISRIGFTIRTVVENARLAERAAAGARAAAALAKEAGVSDTAIAGVRGAGVRVAELAGSGVKGVRASKVAIAGLRDTKAGGAAAKVGRGANKVLNPFADGKPLTVAYGTGTAASVISSALAKDPRDWTTEDVVAMVAGGVLGNKVGPGLAKLYQKARLGGPITHEAINGVLIGSATNVSSQLVFHGKVDPVQLAYTGAVSGAGGAAGRASVRGLLKARGLHRPPAPGEKRSEADEVLGESIHGLGKIAVGAPGKGLVNHQINTIKADAKQQPRLAGNGIPRTGFDPQLPRPVLHVIKPGESLWSIAGERRNDPQWWKHIARANPGLRDPSLIQPGDRLYIPAS